MLTTTHAQSLALKAKLFRGFSDPSRLSILEALRDEARSVGELVEMTGLSQSNVSNHLACLLDCGLVLREPQGRRVIYRIADERVGSLLALADELMEEVAQDVYVCPRCEAPTPSAPVPISPTRPAAQ
jgi:DNA-binding transcriptional ArsR family regulator